MAEYASQAVGGAGLTTGIIGSALGVLNSGLLNGNGIFGGNTDSDSKMVSRYELALTQENAILKAQADVDKKLVDVYNSVNDKINRIITDQSAINSAQAVSNCAVTSQLAVLNNNVAQLQSMTRTVIPNSSVCPGWGTATVSVSTGTTTA